MRSGFAESLHRGSVLTAAPDGSRLFTLGDVDAPVFPRSSLKPLQAVGMVRSGLVVDAPDLALGTASHSGEPFHVERVRAMLASAGLTESALGCPPSMPLSEEAAAAVLRGGGGPSRILMNCSGKHAAMLRTCVAAGWPVAGYRDPGHPLQLALRAAVEDLAAEKATALGVDGCGAPVFALSLAGLARAYRCIVQAEPGSAERAVGDAMRRHPELVGGTGRDVTRLMTAFPGLLAKDGAEGVYAVALPSGAVVVVKIDDGAARARAPVVAYELRRLGVDVAGVGELADLVEPPVLGGGRRVGSVEIAY